MFLERSGGAFRLAASILRVTGQQTAPMAMSIMGYIVSIPVSCDSGYRLHAVGALVQGLVSAVGVRVAGMLLL